MRFGEQLRTSKVRDWEYNYIDYDHLKQCLEGPSQSRRRSSGKSREWTEDDEKRFVEELESELDKVFTFQKVKSGEIVRRIKAEEAEVKSLIARAKRQGEQQGQEQPDQYIEEDFQAKEEDLSEIIADVHDLAKFTQLNYTGFQKIIKKHDVCHGIMQRHVLGKIIVNFDAQKQTTWQLKPAFATRLSSKPFYKENYDKFIVQLSSLYDLVRTRGNPTKGDSAAGGAQQNFVRQTTKYWVHKDNIMELKLIILKHLPVLVFNASKEFDPADAAISSIYYDNTDTWELYTGRLKKTEGAEAIRIRWYGGMDQETVFVERKTHREDWTGEKSVKARFAMKEKNVNSYLKGELSAEKIFEKMRRDGKKSEKEIDDLEQLAREIQYRVITRHLVPVTRSFYNRTAFQLPGDARVRISLDTELTMVREDNLDGRDRAGKNWRRMDIGIDWPFTQLPKEDVEHFPYAVLEVKLQTQAGQLPPEWIRELTASHLVEAVPKYSKFIHGTATLNPTRIHLLPFWMPQMDVDIRKPISHRFGIDRPGQSTDISTTENLDDSDDEDADIALPGDEEDDNENMKKLREARDQMEQNEIRRHADGQVDGAADGAARRNELDIEERIAAAPLQDPSHDYPLYDSDDETDDLEEARRVGGLHYQWLLFKHNLSTAGEKAVGLLKKTPVGPSSTKMPSNGPTMGIPRGTGEVKKFKAPKGKRIHVPIRVEPKVYFAAERTFLSWLEFSIIIGSIAATLLNFGDTISLASAWGFTIVAMCALFYSMGLYVFRVNAIRYRRAVRYHDKYGPTALCLGLLVAVAVSFGYRIVKGGDHGGLKGHW